MFLYTALALQIRRPENETPSVSYRPRQEDPRVTEGRIRQMEAINSYARLVSVGHPAVNELPYPPVVKEGQLPSRPPATEPVIIRVPENPSNSYPEQTSNKEKGERYQDKPLLTRPGYYQTESVVKPYWTEETVVVGTPSDSYVQRPQQESERYRSRYEGSSTIIGKPYSTDEVVLKVSQSFERPTGRRVPDPPRSAEQSYQINQANQAQQSSQSYLSAQQVYQQEQKTNSETQKYYQPEINQPSSLPYQQHQTSSETQQNSQENQPSRYRPIPQSFQQQSQQTNAEKFYQPEIIQQSTPIYQKLQQTSSETKKYYPPENNSKAQQSSQSYLPTLQTLQQHLQLTNAEKLYQSEISQVNQQSGQSYLPVQQTYQQQSQQSNSENKFYQPEINQQSSSTYQQQTSSETKKYYPPENNNKANQVQQSSQGYLPAQQTLQQSQQSNSEKFYQPEINQQSSPTYQQQTSSETKKYYPPESSQTNQAQQSSQNYQSNNKQIYQQEPQQQTSSGSQNYYQPEVSHTQQSSQTYKQQLLPQQTNPETQKYYQQPVSDRPYIITSSGIDLDGRYENTIPVSEQPKQKLNVLPEAYIVRTEKPPQENERPSTFVESDRPINGRPHGIPSPESERIEVVHLSQEAKGPTQQEFRSELTSNQNQPIQPINQEFRPESPRSSIEKQKVPSTFYPIGPVRAYQVTQAIYSSPPNRFFQLPAPLPNPFENQFQSPPSSPVQSPQPPAPSVFENNDFPPGDSWSVNPVQYPASISTNRPFPGLSQLPEEPHSSDRFALNYRPALPYVESHRLNRSLSHFVPILEEQQQQQPLVYDRPVVKSEETFRYPSQEPFSQPTYDDPVVLEAEYYNSQQKSEENSQDNQQRPEGDLTGVKGTPGVDYPIYNTVPTDLKFKCEMVDSPGTRHPAYYADPYTRCQVYIYLSVDRIVIYLLFVFQVFHVCQSTLAKDSFLCPNGTIFNQKVRVCDWWHNVQCGRSIFEVLFKIV